jgi:hypothetical protein
VEITSSGISKTDILLIISFDHLTHTFQYLIAVSYSTLATGASGRVRPSTTGAFTAGAAYVIFPGEKVSRLTGTLATRKAKGMRTSAKRIG